MPEIPPKYPPKKPKYPIKKQKQPFYVKTWEKQNYLKPSLPLDPWKPKNKFNKNKYPKFPLNNYGTDMWVVSKRPKQKYPPIQPPLGIGFELQKKTKNKFVKQQYYGMRKKPKYGGRKRFGYGVQEDFRYRPDIWYLYGILGVPPFIQRPLHFGLKNPYFGLGNPALDRSYPSLVFDGPPYLLSYPTVVLHNAPIVYDHPPLFIDN